MPERILVPLSLQGPATEAIRYATALARERGAGLLLLHVAEVPLDESARYEATGRRLLATHLAQLAALEPADPRVRCERLVELGDAARRIVEVAARERVSTIVLQGQRARWLPRLLRDNVVDQVVRAAPCPVVNVPAGAARASPLALPEPLPPRPARARPSTEDELLARLRTTLSAEVTSLTVWMQTQESAASFVARVPTLVPLVARLRELAGAGEPELLRTSAALAGLRDYFRPVCLSCGFSGFTVTDASGVTLAASEDDALGRTSATLPHASVARALEGRAVVSQPCRTGAGALAMFASAPILLDGDGSRPGAVLSLRIRPELDYLRILSAARPGATCETYTFDERGVLLSNSRFGEQLRRAGLLAPDSPTDGVLDLRACDPGGNLMAGFRPDLPPDARPLTRMAALATSGKDGIDLDGYRDYRGVEVVGAWLWLNDFGLGIATEMDVAEAY